MRHLFIMCLILAASSQAETTQLSRVRSSQEQQARGDAYPPQDMPGLVQRANAVIIGRVTELESQPRISQGPNGVQLYHVEVSEVFKGAKDAHVGRLTVGVPATRGRTGRDRWEFTGLETDKEYVLFLVWDPRINAFVVLYDTTGIYETDVTGVKTSSNVGVAAKQRGRSRSELLDELRRLGDRQQR